ncbi:MAG: bifunctional metallophosphatase/5'-nucleotidase [Rhodocyclaceae bacterium]|jgi:5'-nucleotidase|nr:bifunctional metallophosphatase/5'-nucleotidase [Rhodocyclaceae bacterium]
MNRFTPLALLLAAFAAPACAQVTCTTPDPSPTVVIGQTDSQVPNRAVRDRCTIDDLIQDEGQWGSERDFLFHANQVTVALLKRQAITPVERLKIMQAARESEVGRYLTVKLIGFNDFHGNIEAGGSNPGVARFATRIAQLKAANPLHAVVSAGDMIGASPLASALFHDEPTIEAMNRIAIDFNAVGNHEFDEGREELLRMQHGGSHPSDPNSSRGLAEDLKNGQFAGARFKFLAANVVDRQQGGTLFPAYAVKDFLGNKVAFIGMTLKATPTIVTPSGVAGLEFRDEADTVNALIPELRDKGIHSVVVLIHEGGLDTTGAIGDCEGISGPIVDIVNRLDAEVDLVVSGHTHQAYNCLINGKRVTSAGQYGRVLSDIDLTLDTRARDVAQVSATNLSIPNAGTVAEDPRLTPLVAHYVNLAAQVKNRVIGTITAPITRSANAAGESALGDVIADAQLAATAPAGFGEAVVAFMNPGGIRADLGYPGTPGVDLDGQVTYGEAFSVQPFGNSLVTLSLTGAQLKTLLETQFAGCNGQSVQRILQVSDSLRYRYSAGAACGSRIDPASLTIQGQLVTLAASYRVTVNSFLADGGDGFAVLKEGTNRLGGAQDLDAWEAYFTANPGGVAPGQQDRITLVP